MNFYGESVVGLGFATCGCPVGRQRLHVDNTSSEGLLT